LKSKIFHEFYLGDCIKSPGLKLLLAGTFLIDYLPSLPHDDPQADGFGWLSSPAPQADGLGRLSSPAPQAEGFGFSSVEPQAEPPSDVEDKNRFGFE